MANLKIKTGVRYTTDATDDAIAIRYREILRKHVLYFLSTPGTNEFYTGHITKADNNTYDGGNTRGAGFWAFGMAIALFTGIEFTESQKTEMRRRIHAICSKYAWRHFANQYGGGAVTSSNFTRGWGWYFSSGIDTPHYVIPAILFPELFSAQDHEYIKNMVIREADGLAYGQFNTGFDQGGSSGTCTITAPPNTRPSSLSNSDPARRQARAFARRGKIWHDGENTVTVIMSDHGGGYDKDNPPILTISRPFVFKMTNNQRFSLIVNDDGTVKLPPAGCWQGVVNNDGWGDNQSWRAWPLEVAIAYLRNHPNVDDWKAAISRYRMSMISSFNDFNDERMVDGVPAKDLIPSSEGGLFPTYNRWYVYGNHGNPAHPSYNTGTLRAFLVGAIYSMLAGNDPLQIYSYNSREVWGGLAVEKYHRVLRNTWQPAAGRGSVRAYPEISRNRIFQLNGETNWNSRNHEHNRRGNFWASAMTAALVKLQLKYGRTKANADAERLLGTDYAGVWESRTPYSIGKYVKYNDKYYRCKVARTTSHNQNPVADTTGFEFVNVQPTAEEYELGYLGKLELAQQSNGKIGGTDSIAGGGIGHNQNTIRDTAAVVLAYHMHKNRPIAELETLPAKPDPGDPPTADHDYDDNELQTFGTGNNPQFRYIGMDFGNSRGKPLATPMRFGEATIYSMVLDRATNILHVWYDNRGAALDVNLEFTASGISDTFTVYDFTLEPHDGQTGGCVRSSTHTIRTQDRTAALNVFGGSNVVRTRKVNVNVDVGTSRPAAQAPAVSNFAITAAWPSAPAANVNLGGARTLDYTIANGGSNISQIALQVDPGSGTFADVTLTSGTLATGNGNNRRSVTLPAITTTDSTSSTTVYRARIRVRGTNGTDYYSNVITATVPQRASQPQGPESVTSSNNRVFVVPPASAQGVQGRNRLIGQEEEGINTGFQGGTQLADGPITIGGVTIYGFRYTHRAGHSANGRIRITYRATSQETIRFTLTQGSNSITFTRTFTVDTGTGNNPVNGNPITGGVNDGNLTGADLTAGLAMFGGANVSAFSGSLLTNAITVVATEVQ